jgi:hypothetical protein
MKPWLSLLSCLVLTGASVAQNHTVIPLHIVATVLSTRGTLIVEDVLAILEGMSNAPSGQAAVAEIIRGQR